MINLYWLFWIMVLLFAIIGAVRGWSKEVIALAGLILAMFTINTFGWTLVNLLGGLGGNTLQVDVLAGMKEQFIFLGGVLVLVGFFSYQSVALLTARLSGRERLQERLLGFIFGAFNGYLVVGGLWSLLEYRIGPEGWNRLPPGVDYVFSPNVSRPLIETAGLEMLMTHMPLPWLDPWIPVLMVLVFLFLIIVVI